MKKKRKTKIDWLKIKNDYIHKNISLQKLAEKYSVSERQVMKHSSDEEWVKQKEENSRIVAEETQKELQKKEIARKVAVNEAHLKLYDDGIEVVEKILAIYKDKINENNSKKLKVNPFNLEKVFSCIEKAQKGQRLALNMEKEDVNDDLPRIISVQNLDMDKI